MPVRITCRKTEISPAMRDLVETKARKLNKYFDKVDRIDVIFNAEKHRRKVELNVHAAPFFLSSTVEGQDDQACFDKALKIIQRKLKNEKAKMLDRKHRGNGEKIAMPEMSDIEDEDEDLAEAE